VRDESDREDNAVGAWDEDLGQRQAYAWEWEPNAIDRRNKLMNAQQVQVKWYQLQRAQSSVENQREILLTVGSSLICIAIIILSIMLFLLASAVHGQEVSPRLPAFESQFVWAQLTWDKSENQWCIDAQPKDAGPGKMVGACAETLRDAQRAVMSADNTAQALPVVPEPKVAVIAPYGNPEPIVQLYWDRQNKRLATLMVSVGSFDLAQTCHSIANGGREVWMPMKSCGSLVGVGIAMGLGMTYLSYQLHRHGHHRLERIPFIGMIASNTAGIAYSKKNGAW